MKNRMGFLTLVGALALVSQTARAANYFVLDTIAAPGVRQNDARSATSLVRDAVSSRPGDIVIQDEYQANFVLQPRLMKLGNSFILSVDKQRGQQVVFTAQSKVATIDQLDRAARSATTAAIDEPSGTAASRSATSMSAADVPPPGPAAAQPAPGNMPPPETPPAMSPPNPPTFEAPPAPASEAAAGEPNRISAHGVEALPPGRKVSYWTAGFGPFLSRHLDSDTVMYDATGGHVWDINPRVAIKATGEAAFSSGADKARFFNLATGANYYFPGDVDSAPFLTGDIGYGFAANATNQEGEGFSLGVGAGYEFFRSTQTTLDLLLRFATIFDNTAPGSGNPSVIGARLAVNF